MVSSCSFPFNWLGFPPVASLGSILHVSGLGLTKFYTIPLLTLNCLADFRIDTPSSWLAIIFSLKSDE
ncbi:hypothetical protein [Pleurocapsa sp. FMAR1]|uniref:hypothetical protein n=1 Tax=Pleurocapsa sp. FMAR1 TaxID=3040204 RepID=UPI0029C6BB2F|nr:hypothetical protein [Pleurocapsa sp. FMAR1]